MVRGVVRRGIGLSSWREAWCCISLVSEVERSQFSDCANEL